MWLSIMRQWVRFRWLFRLAFFAVLGLGIYLGMHPDPPPTPNRTLDWSFVYHAGGLFVCTWLSYLAFPRWRWWWRGGLMFAVGIAIEFVQSYHPTRSADINDIYANTFGVALGLITLGIYRWLLMRWARTH
ncbi:MAG: VanZ family protein [Gammaproteobacteria bacterium]|nr:VanZ family protein [Gammaproteobacteria bacterium]